MGIVELFLVALALAMDAFAASVGKGLDMPRMNWRQALVIAFAFGAFQALMPVLGWLLGAQFETLVNAVAHWIALALLVFIGVKTIREALDAKDAPSGASSHLDAGELLMLAVATSIDAFALGVVLAFMQADIVLSALVIGLVTFALSLVGVSLGHMIGKRGERLAGLAGGIVLILIGLKIVADHYGLLPF